MKSRGWILVLVVAASLVAVVPVMAASPGPDKFPRAFERPPAVIAEAQGRRRDRIAGKVVSVEGNTIALGTPRGQVDVVTDAATRFIMPGVESPGLDAVVPGMKLAAQGRRDSDVFRARVVLVVPENVGRFQGEVATVGPDSFTLNTAGQTLTVAVNERTRFILPGTEDPGLDDLAVGETVIVAGQTQDDGTFLARLVTRLRPRIGKISGTVTAVGADSLTVQRRDGSETTGLVNDETDIFVPGVENATLADVKVGDKVQVQGNLEDDTAVALRIVVISPEAAALLGEVASVEGATVQVKTRTDQVIAVETDALTRMVIPGVAAPALADLRVGDKVRIGGEWQDAGTFHAWVINVGRQGRVGRVQGRILSVAGSEFTLGSPQGSITVAVDDETRYTLPDVETPGFDDLKKGQWAVVIGLLEEDGALLARSVQVRSR